MHSHPELKRPFAANPYPTEEAMDVLYGWSAGLRRLRYRRGEDHLPLGLNLHSIFHLREHGFISNEREMHLAPLLHKHWRTHLPGVSDHVSVTEYVEEHATFEERCPVQESVEWIVDALDQLPEVTQAPEFFVGDTGHTYWAQRFPGTQPHSVLRSLLGAALDVTKDIVDRTYVTRHDNVHKALRLRDQPLWLITPDPDLLGNLELDHASWRPAQRLVLAIEPINSGRVNFQDLFLFDLEVVGDQSSSPDGAWRYGAGDVYGELQVPAPVRHNPEMEVRNAMKLYLSAGLVKNRRIMLEFNKFTTYYAETFDLRHAPVKGGAMRYLMGTERAHLHINASPHPNHPYLEIRIETVDSSSKAFYGRLVAFLGAFMAHCKVAFGEELLTDPQHNELVDPHQIEVWGNWAYQEVLKRYPSLAG